MDFVILNKFNKWQQQNYHIILYNIFSNIVPQKSKTLTFLMKFLSITRKASQAMLLNTLAAKATRNFMQARNFGLTIKAMHLLRCTAFIVTKRGEKYIHHCPSGQE
jgi:hypothetical protein